VPTRDPHDVLGVEPGASPDDIKAAWRALARRHHPDLTGDDPASVTRATRRMAEINAAYAALTREAPASGSRRGGGRNDHWIPSPHSTQGVHPGRAESARQPEVPARLFLPGTVARAYSTPPGLVDNTG